MKRSELRNIIREEIQKIFDDRKAAKELGMMKYGGPTKKIPDLIKKLDSDTVNKVANGEYRKKYGLDTSKGSVYDFYRYHGLSDRDAQIMHFIDKGIIKEGMDAKKALKDAGIPYSYRKDKIGNKQVFLKTSNIDPVIKKLTTDGWSGGMKKDAPSSGAVTYVYKKGNNELKIYVSGYDKPQVDFK